MLGTISNLKENLNKIALDVHYHDNDHDVVFPMNGTATAGDNHAVSDSQNSHSFAHSRSPVTNGIADPPYASEIEQYKTEIKRLQASEAEIKALSVNYAVLLKEKEVDSYVRHPHQPFFPLHCKLDPRIG